MSKQMASGNGRRRWSDAAGVAAALVVGAAAWAESPAVGPVPEAVRAEYNLSPFYRKHIDGGGFAILSSEKVSDYALKEAHYIIESMLADRQDIRAALRQCGFRCAIMASDEFTTDIPEHSDLDPKDFWDRRARGLGPTRHRPCISGAEENLLQYAGDPYAEENILVHEFAHAIHEALRVAEPEFDRRLKEVYEEAKKEKLWEGKYAASNRYEYWGECVQSYFGDNRENDASHNHVNTREELFEYDPRMARLADETFRGNPWRYVRPDRRAEPGHLAGFDRSRAPRFTWPERLREATRKRRENRPGSSIERVERKIEGWAVRVDIQLVEGFDEALGREALTVLEHKLREVRLLVPEKPLAELRRVPVILDREHPGLSAMQYHPSAAWLREHGYDPEMARCVHIPRAAELVTLHSVNRQPFAVLHELAHAYHDQVLGFEETRIAAAWRVFRESGRSENVLHASGRRQEHYGRKDAKEFFAEMTEAYFGVNDFYPFVRAELKEAEPELEALLESVWGR